MLISGPSGTRLSAVHLDALLCISILAVIALGLVVHSRDVGTFQGQLVRMVAGLVALVVAAWVEPRQYLSWAPAIYSAAVGLLLLVFFLGTSAKGSQRWIDLPGLPQFQPSELTKVAIPLMLAWYFQDRRLPPRFRDMLVALAIIAAPVLLIVQQPDLGTGFVGVLLLLLFYLVILARGLHLATLAPSRFGRLLAGGLMLTFFGHVFVNIAMVCGLIPVVGVPLPLVSYGGTSALSILIGCGIVMSIHTHRTGRR